MFHSPSLEGGVRYTLSAEVMDESHAIQVFHIKNSKPAQSILLKCMRAKAYVPDLYLPLKRTLTRIIFSFPLSFAQDLLEYGNKRTALEVQTDGTNTQLVKEKLNELLGVGFSVLTNKEQHKDLYRLLKFEKLFSFFSLSLLLLVGSINMFFSLMMLAIGQEGKTSAFSPRWARHRLLSKRFF